MSGYTFIPGNNGECIQINWGDVVRFRYPVAGHETGIFKSSNGEYCMIELSLVEAGRPVTVERYRWEIIV